MEEVDKFLQALKDFKDIHDKMTIPQMIYSTIVSNKLKLSDLLYLDIEEWNELMDNAINNERDTLSSVEDIDRMIKKYNL